MFDNDFETLEPDKSIALWLQGRDAWNTWVEKNPEYNIDFSHYDFSIFRENFHIISFKKFNFPKGTVDFSGTEFGNGAVDFSEAKFNDGDVDFFYAQFDGEHVNFSSTKFGNGYVNFSKVKFGGAAFFLKLRGIENVQAFSFRYAVFDGPFDIYSEEGFPCLIDLTHTKTAHHISLAELKCVLRCEGESESYFDFDRDWVKKKTVADRAYIVMARRLKELAEENKDHQAAQDFHVLKMQAKRVFKKPKAKLPRWFSVCLFKCLPVIFFKQTYKVIYKFVYRPLSGFCNSYIWNTEFWYEKLSDYGRSIKRPVGRLIFIWLLWSEIYMMVSIMGKKNAIEPFTSFCLNALAYSASQMFAFIPSSPSVRSKSEHDLYCELVDGGWSCKDMPEWIFLFTFSQSILALILLFLLGLGLRHRYRI